MDLQTIHNHILLRINKDQSGYVSHAEIDKALDFYQMVYFNKLFGSPNTYQPGRHVATPGYGTTQKIHDDLAPFKKVVIYNDEPLTAVNHFGTSPSGISVMPTDYLHMLAMYIGTSDYTQVEQLSFDAGTVQLNPSIIEGGAYKLVIFNEDGDAFDGNLNLAYDGDEIADGTVTQVIFYADASYADLDVTSDIAGSITVYKKEYPSSFGKVEFLSEDQWAHRISSKLLTPSSSEPIAKVLGKNGNIEGEDADGNATVISFTNNVLIQLWPKEGYDIECVYLRRPTAPNYSYTTSGRTETYSAANSTQMEWNDQALTVIMEGAINILAQNLQDQMLDRHTEIKNQQPR